MPSPGKKRCGRCKGKGWVYKRATGSANRTTITCPRCHGEKEVPKDENSS